MEHIACINKNVKLMTDIGPKFDTKDYYGNLPLHYTIMKDDTEMIRQNYL
jgi:ankyrin repeat protein